MSHEASHQPFPQPEGMTTRKAVRHALAGLCLLALFALAGCSSGDGDTPVTVAPVVESPAAAPTDDAQAPPEPSGVGVEETGAEDPTGEGETPADEPAATDVIRYGLGDTFTAGDTFFGIFDITYVGIAKTGELDDGEVGCFAVLVEATLQEMPADNEDPAVGGLRNNVLDANGDKAADNFSSECPLDSFLRENGYPSTYDIEWVAGTPTKLTIATLTIPADSMDKVDSVDIDPTKKSVLDFEVTESW